MLLSFLYRIKLLKNFSNEEKINYFTSSANGFTPSSSRRAIRAVSPREDASRSFSAIPSKHLKFKK